MAESIDMTGKSQVMEIYVKQLEMKASKKLSVYFEWISETTRSKSSHVTIYPYLNKHLVDEKLSLTHEFKSTASSMTHLKLYESSEGSGPRLLGECEIDLKKLLNVTSPVKFKFHNDLNESISIHTYVASSLWPKSMKQSKTMVWTRSTTLKEKDGTFHMNRTIAESVKPAFQHQFSMLSANESDIYDKINKMSVKLSTIEKEILKKTYKLSQLNKENVTEMTKIKAKLEKDLMKKDLQIKILINQLDELHTSLALSHQRELELTDRVNLQALQDEFPIADPNERTLRRGGYRTMVRADFNATTGPYNKSIIDDLETNLTDLQRFKEDYETLNEPGVKIHKFKEIIHNLENIRKLPRYLSEKSSTHSTDTFRNKPSLLNSTKGHREDQIFAQSNRMVKRSIGLLKDRIPGSGRPMDDFNMFSLSENKMFKTQTIGVNGTGMRFTLDRQSQGMQVPRLVESKDKVKMVIGGGVFIPSVIDGHGGSGSSREGSVNGKQGEALNSTIRGLERELINAKVRLADSETTKEVYKNQLRAGPVPVMG